MKINLESALFNPGNQELPGPLKYSIINVSINILVLLFWLIHLLFWVPRSKLIQKLLNLDFSFHLSLCQLITPNRHLATLLKLSYLAQKSLVKISNQKPSCS